MITYVSKENNLGPGDKIRYIWGLKGPILFCKGQLVHTNFLYPYQVLSFYEIKPFTRAIFHKPRTIISDQSFTLIWANCFLWN